MAGRMAGPIKTKLGIGTRVDPRSVLVKVKVIYLCVLCNRIHDRKFMLAPPGEQHARSSCSSSSCHLVNANKTPDRPARAERIRNLRPEDGYRTATYS